jgi:hypothetical protein
MLNKKKISLILALLIIGFLGLLPAYSVWAVEIPPPSPSGLVVVFEQNPLFSETDFLPGQTVTRWVQVGNFSGQTQPIAVEAINISDPNNFGDVLNLQIKEGENALFDGTLSQFFSQGETYLSDLADGLTTQYDFLVTFLPETGNTYQQANLGFDLIVGFQGQEGVGGAGGGAPPVSLPHGLTILNQSVEVTTATQTSVTITWYTSYPSTSQIIYSQEGENHTLDLSDNTGAPPKYGYAHTTLEYDLTPKTKNHSVTITGLTPGTTYYFRCVSHASLAISREFSFRTKGGKIAPKKKTEILPKPGASTPGAPEVKTAPKKKMGPIAGKPSVSPKVSPPSTLPPLQTPVGKKKIAPLQPLKKTAGLKNYMFAAMGGIANSKFLLIISIFLLLALIALLVKEAIFRYRKRKRRAP